MFLMGSGFVCEPGDPSTCPATAKNTQGDSYELSGVGSFEPTEKIGAGSRKLHSQICQRKSR
jgi:hypothetical protein